MSLDKIFKILASALFVIFFVISPNFDSVAFDEEEDFVNNLARDTYTYLTSYWATSYELPWSWRSQTISGGNYTNTTEIGLLLLAHIGAYELNRSWSPDWQTVELKLIAILNRLNEWQIDPPNDTTAGTNAYQNSVFYWWYDLGSEPPAVGVSDNDRLVPSIDNAFLAASLITLREYGTANEHPQIAEKADAILNRMNFRLWYNTDTDQFYLGTTENPYSGVVGDYYSNENRIINFVARALEQLTSDEYLASLDALVQPSKTYNSITVQKVAWDGSYFTYTAPGIFIREIDTRYAQTTLFPATQAQIAYAINEEYPIWGLSDCFDIGDGSYIQQGAPPTGKTDSAETNPGLVTPHASAMALVTSYRDEALQNLQTTKTMFPNSYDPTYGFYDSVMADPDSLTYGDASDRFSAIAQGWLFVSIVNAETNLIWDYFYRDPGVRDAHREMFEMQINYDVNGDSWISPVDVIYVINRLGSNGAEAMEADLNGDGIVTSTDVQLVLIYLGEQVR